MFGNAKEIAELRHEIEQIKRDLNGLFNNMNILVKRLSELENEKKTQYMG